MVSTPSLVEKFNQVRRNFCFYLDIQDNEAARNISRKIQEMNLQQEVFLTRRVTHVIRDRASERAPVGGVVGVGGSAGVGGCGAGPRWRRREPGRARADAMLERVRPAHHSQQQQQQQHNYVQLTVQKAKVLLDKLYDTFFRAVPPQKLNVWVFSKHFIKIEFLDKIARPVYKEFDEWPEISLEPDQPKEKKERKESTEFVNNITYNIQNTTSGQKMTRKSRPRIKEREEKEHKGGYCEMCNTDYVDAALHQRSPHHLTFIRDHANFLSLDSLIEAGADVATFLDKATPIYGERRSLRKLCNGDIEQPKNKRSKRSQSPDSPINFSHSPRRNGAIEDDRRRNTRCNKRGSDSQISEDRQYYKVVGVSTKLRSSGGFATKRKDSPPTCNGTKPLVVKFRKVRRSELSVLSDEAEQFMFPKRASSTSSTSSDEDDKEEIQSIRRKSPPPPPPMLERRRLARPLALKEESSEEDNWPEDRRRRKRRGGVVAKRTRRVPGKPVVSEPKPESVEPAEPAKPEGEISPLREPSERCMKWEDGKLKYTPAVEQLEFAFESVPYSEPWYETFKRQDQDKISTRNVPQFFALYTKSPKLPYEIGQLPPLKPNCCTLSDLVRRDDKPGPSRSYGTRGMKKQKIRKRTAAILALDGHPRKSPREHASTLAILGSAGLLHRRKHAEDAKSTASEDTISETQSNTKMEPILSETQEASERLQQFLSEVFEDATEYEAEGMDMGDPAVITSTTVPDILSLVSECEDCDIIRNEIKEGAAERARGRRGKFKKKNRTGWPNKRKQVKKSSRTNSADLESKPDSSLDRSSVELADDDTTQGTLSDDDRNLSETEIDKTLTEDKAKSEDESRDKSEESTTGKPERKEKDAKPILRSDDKSLRLDVKVLLHDKVKEEKASKSELEKDEKRTSRSSASETEDKSDKERKKKRSVQGLGDWLQPVVRVARVDPGAARRLRSAGRAAHRLR